MKIEHVPFEKMSDLHDNLIDTTEEKEEIITHFDQCSDCSEEFNRLKRMICHLEAFRDCDFCIVDVTGKTMKKMAWRQRKNRLYRALPAVAASFVLIAGFGLYSGGYLDSTGDTSIQGSMALSSMKGNDTAKVIKIIGDHKARIVKVSELFVEGEIPYRDFKRLRRDLGFRKVVYNVSDHSSSRPVKAGMNNNIRAVGLNSGIATANNGYREPAERELYVRFRVFK